ncbi:hypothetical protein RRG08_042463 [Elysia crispata]|uniref:Uncharacterized protein n=1 Tax=Elysia crispata TaxID=231223 RepID=A0AAE0ZCC6_9GAST|nr:hypothetical protein RRG08_042463 [Elysia crispata]
MVERLVLSERWESLRVEANLRHAPVQAVPRPTVSQPEQFSVAKIALPTKLLSNSALNNQRAPGAILKHLRYTRSEYECPSLSPYVLIRLELH